MKRKSFTLFLFVFMVSSIYAQVPDAFQYQAFVSNSQSVMANADVSVRFHIRENTVTGTKVYTETHQTKTNSFGMVSLKIGKGTAETGIFSSIEWSKGIYFIESEIDKGAGFVSTGTQQLMSVPYAKYASHAKEIIITSSSGKKFSLTIDEQGNLATKAITE